MAGGYRKGLSSSLWCRVWNNWANRGRELCGFFQRGLNGWFVEQVLSFTLPLHLGELITGALHRYCDEGRECIQIEK